MDPVDQKLPDTAYNPTIREQVFRFRGMAYAFPPGFSPFHITHDYAEKMDAVMMFNAKMTQLGLKIFVMGDSPGVKDTHLPEAEQAALFKKFMQGMATEGLNHFERFLDEQYVQMPEADNRKLAGVNKEGLRETPLQRRMRNLLRLVREDLDMTGDLTETEQMAADERAMKNRVDLDLRSLNWKELRKVARQRGIAVPRGATQDDLLAAMIPGFKPGEGSVPPQGEGADAQDDAAQ